MTNRDLSLDTLLDLDGQILVIDEKGQFVKFEVSHMYDHVHRGKDDKGRPYKFVNAGKLIEDFWAEVDRILDLDKE